MRIKQVNIYRNPAELCAALSAEFESNGIAQKRIERDTGIHQSQVSRILSGEIRRVSKNVLRLCKYANISPHLSGDYTPTDDRALMEAIEIAVAGRPERARALAGVIKAVARALDAQPQIHQLGD
jgi:transcriptional regulator with XRE-family HTH domain